jgi:hypothetical protein
LPPFLGQKRATKFRRNMLLLSSGYKILHNFEGKISLHSQDRSVLPIFRRNMLPCLDVLLRRLFKIRDNDVQYIQKVKKYLSVYSEYEIYRNLTRISNRTEKYESIKITYCWDVTPCRLGDRYEYYELTCRSHLVEISARHSKTLVNYRPNYAAPHS